MAYYVKLGLLETQIVLRIKRVYEVPLKLKDALRQVPEGYCLFVVRARGRGDAEVQIVFLPGDEEDQKLCRVYDEALRKRLTYVYHIEEDLVLQNS